MQKVIYFLSFLLLNFPLAAQEQDVLDVGMYNQHLKLIDEGWELIHQEKFNEACDRFEKAIQINNGNADAFVGAATAYMHLAKYDSAQTRVDRALRLAANQSDIYYLAGNIAFNSKHYDKALVAYTFAINNNGSSDVKIDLAKGYYNRGNTYLALEKFNSAINDYDKTLQVEYEFANAYHNRGVAYKRLSDDENACRDFHAARHFGSEISEKYILENCEGVNFDEIVYQNIRSSTLSNTLLQDRLTEVDYTDTTFVDTLFYGVDWKLTNKELSSYYRVATINTKKLIFQGEFSDYFRNGQLLLEGSYDQNGGKDGLFNRFYESGNIHSTGNYLNDKLHGTWEYFFDDSGELSEIIQMEEEDYYVINSWDKSGKPGVVDGTGKWKKILFEQDGIQYTLIANFKNKKKVKSWILRTDDGFLIHKEVYKNGKFVKAIHNNGFGFNPSAQLFSVDMFYSRALPVIEKFETSEYAIYHDYPYLSGLNTEIGRSNFISSGNTGSRPSGTLPTYNGGMNAFYKFVADHLIYPIEARKNGTTGKVIVSFNVEKDGSLSNIKCLSNLGSGLEEEAERLISLTNQWVPAIENGKPVVRALALPIIFKLSN